MTPYYKQFTGKSCIPEAVALSGTFISNGRAVTIIDGSNDLKVGDFIYSTSNNQVRKVLSIPSRAAVFIDSTFTVNVKTPENLIIAGRSRFIVVSISNEGGITGKFNGNNFKTGKFLVFVDENGLDPITIDSGDGGGQIVVWGKVSAAAASASS